MGNGHSQNCPRYRQSDYVSHRHIIDSSHVPCECPGDWPRSVLYKNYKGLDGFRLHPDYVARESEILFAGYFEDHKNSLVGSIMEVRSERDEAVLATFAQWLGTDMGLDFIARAINSGSDDTVKKFKRVLERTYANKILDAD